MIDDSMEPADRGVSFSRTKFGWVEDIWLLNVEVEDGGSDYYARQARNNSGKEVILPGFDNNCCLFQCSGKMREA